mmetsp:Transcript_28627/g.80728  ORF Transcript_28627/g.80728 Transcript_28627/m.80728 type:complete len:213 (-) Transcript_28627:2827-3465(-)
MLELQEQPSLSGIRLRKGETRSCDCPVCGWRLRDRSGVRSNEESRELLVDVREYSGKDVLEMIRRQQVAQHLVHLACVGDDAVKEHAAGQRLPVLRAFGQIATPAVEVRVGDARCKAVLHDAADDGDKFVHDLFVVLDVFASDGVEVVQKSVLLRRQLRHQGRTNVGKERKHHPQRLRDQRQVLCVDGLESGSGMDRPCSENEVGRPGIEEA